jgi:hypothetical protein
VDHVGLAVDDEDVDQQECREHTEKHGPVPSGDGEVHLASRGIPGCGN